MSVSICEHIKPSGNRCGSPAMRGQTKCFYHASLEHRLPAIRNMFLDYDKNAPPGVWTFREFPIPVLEDAVGIQIGFMQALHGVTNGNLDPRKAKLVLSALHGARMNLQQLEACFNACAKGAAGKKTKKQPASVKEPTPISRKQRHGIL